MKKILVASTLAATIASQAVAGNLAQPIVEPEVIVEEASASSTGMMIPLILLALVFFAMQQSGPKLCTSGC